MGLCGLWRNKAFLRGDGDVTLNLAQLLCVLQREENWSRERIARRAQPAGSPAGIKASAPAAGRVLPAESSARERLAAPARNAGAAKGESKREKRMGKGGEGQRAGEEARKWERRKT